MKKTLALVAFAGIAAVANADILANWTFETSLPTTAGPHAAEGGVVGGSATGFHASGSTVWSNPVGNGSFESFSSNFWTAGDYYQFSVDTTGYTNIAFGWSQTRSSTGPADFRFEFSTDGGATFSTVLNYTVPAINWSSSVVDGSTVFGLTSVAGADNAGVVLFRLTSRVTPSNTAGTSRVDDIIVSGDLIPAPGALALAGLGGLFAGRRRR